MTEIGCKRCGASDYVKNGIVRGLQRYRCRQCACNFTATQPRGKPLAMKALALLLYGMGNMSFCSIARILQVSDVAVLKWIRAEAARLPEPERAADVVLLTIDEMWHFLKKRPKSFGSGGPMILCSGEPWPGCWVTVTMQPADSSSLKSAWKARRFSPTIGKASTASSRKISSTPAKT